MTLGRRIDERRKALGWSQAELARLAKVPQSTLNTIINSDTRSSPHLVRIARALQTTPAYLTGDIDDPAEGAPPPPPDPQVVHVMLPVALPAEPAMAAMFHGLLLSLGEWQRMETGELARELALLLPTGLGAIRPGLRFEASAPPDAPAMPLEAAEIEAPAPRRARRA